MKLRSIRIAERSDSDPEQPWQPLRREESAVAALWDAHRALRVSDRPSAGLLGDAQTAATILRSSVFKVGSQSDPARVQVGSPKA